MANSLILLANSIIDEYFITVLPPFWIQDCFNRIKNSPGIKISRRRLLDEELKRFWSTTKNTLGDDGDLQELECCDPHDRVYAILGLAADIPGEAILVEYDRLIFKVKTDVAWWYL